MRLFTPEFAADPHGAYSAMRRSHGPLVPVELAAGVPATLVVGYREALHILSDPEHFPADPRAWQATVPERCPVLPMMEWQPGGPAAGSDHQRYRGTYVASLDKVDLYALRGAVERTAMPLINNFCESGYADLLTEYAIPLTVQVLNDLLGFSHEAGAKAFTALAALRDSVDAESAELEDQRFTAAISRVVAAKRSAPGDDVISRLLAHPARLDDAEVVQQTSMLYATGTEPTWNLIANTLLLMATDEQFHDVLIGGALPTREVIDEVLFTDPPLANFCSRYPRQPQVIGGTWLPVHQPVVISVAACNNDPAAVSGERLGNRAHLAWGAGPRSCPAQTVAMVIVQEALDQLLDALPDIQLAVPPEQLEWRPGAFHRAPTAVPVTFPPSPPLTFI